MTERLLKADPRSSGFQPMSCTGLPARYAGGRDAHLNSWARGPNYGEADGITEAPHE